MSRTLPAARSSFGDIRRSLLVTSLFVVLTAAGCADIDPKQVAAGRAVVIETTGCEFASGRTGSGFIYRSGLVVTAAHLVARAAKVDVIAGDESHQGVEVLGVDLERDLAALSVPVGEDLDDVEKSDLRSGEAGVIVGGARSGDVRFEVKRVVDLTIEEVLGTERHSRRGYELAAVTGDGDSGSAVYDDDGRLVGMVFATGPDEDTTWVTASSEIIDFVVSVSDYGGYEACP